MHAERFLSEAAMIANEIDGDAVEKLASELKALRARKGRLFLIGLGGSAANCSHAAADFRTLSEIDAYALPDSFAEFSARANDQSLSEAFMRMLDARKLSSKDALMVLSVGGGTLKVSASIVCALEHAKAVKAKILGIVGPNGGETARDADVVVKIPKASAEHITPHTEAFQAVVFHCLVSHPSLQKHATKW